MKNEQTIETSKIILKYVCVNEGCSCCENSDVYEQPLEEIVSVGTLICPECGNDMELMDNVIVRIN